MRYKSTRNDQNIVDSSFAILHGLAVDGGLYIPEILPNINISYDLLKDMTYQEIAFYTLKNFFPDLNDDELKTSIDNAYNPNTFNSPEISPLVNLDSNVSFTELYHGRTLAFKDLALSLFPYLLVLSKKTQNESNDIMILTATSGDTGKAALEGFKDIQGINITVFYPKDGVSSMQEDQMRKQLGNNVDIVAIDGNFDDAQSAVKTIFSSEYFKKTAHENNITFSSANSINIGRLFPQVVYYITTYINLLKNKNIDANEKFNIVVPTGNFGNILAAYIAKKLGVPINKLISASNENNILADFFNTGIYNKDRNFYVTNSPSMDIIISSNFERYLYYVTGENSSRINELMDSLNKTNKLAVSPKELEDIQKEFYGNFATEADTIETIKKLYHEKNYLMDPHTAVAYSVWEKYKTETNDNTHTVIMSTAHPYKFPDAVSKALDIKKLDDSYDLIDNIHDKTKIEIPVQFKELKNLPIRFSTFIKKDEIINYIDNKIKK